MWGCSRCCNTVVDAGSGIGFANQTNRGNGNFYRGWRPGTWGLFMSTFLRWLLVLMAIPAFVCAVLIYAPPSLLISLDKAFDGDSLQTLRTTYAQSCRGVLRHTGIVAASALWGITVLTLVRARYKRVAMVQRRFTLLHQTSDDQRFCLRKFMGQKRPLEYPLLDTTIQELRHGGILKLKKGAKANFCVQQPHVLVPWARQLLQQHPELLEINEDEERHESALITHPFTVNVAV